MQMPHVDVALASSKRLVAHAQRDDDLLERRVARALAEAVDRALDLRRAGGEAGERVGDGEAEVVVAVHRQLDAIELGAERAHLVEEPRELVGKGVADGVRKVDDVGAGRDRGAAGLGEELRLRARRVLGRELDLVRTVARVRDRPLDPLEHLLRLEAELSLHMQRDSWR